LIRLAKAIVVGSIRREARPRVDVDAAIQIMVKHEGFFALGELNLVVMNDVDPHRCVRATKAVDISAHDIKGLPGVIAIKLRPV
jgi:hypothetical protein